MPPIVPGAPTAPGAVISYAAKAAEAVNTRTKREGVSDSDWATQKTALLGSANFYTGVGYSHGDEIRPGQQGAARRSAEPSRATQQLYAMRSV